MCNISSQKIMFFKKIEINWKNVKVYANIDWKENIPILSSPKDVSTIPLPVSYSFSLADNKQSLKTLFLQVFLNVYEKSTLDAI